MIFVMYFFMIPLITVISFLGWYELMTRNMKNKLKEFPTLPTVPLLGSIHIIYGSTRGRVKKFLTILDKFGKSPFVVWLSYTPVVVLTNGEDIQAVSKISVDRDVKGLFKDSLGDGITVARAEKWKKTRRLINPAFAPVMLKQYFSVFNEQAKILVYKLAQPAKSGTVIDVWPYMANANIDIITENITGNRLKTQENFGSDFSNALLDTLKLESMRFMMPWLLSSVTFYLYRLFIGKQNLFKVLHQLPKEVLKQKKHESNVKKITGESDELVYQPKTLIDILYGLRETNQEFTEKQMQNEMLNIIATGSESTAIMTSFTLLMLAMHQEEQERAFQEISKFFIEKNQSLNMNDLNELKYLEQCIKETLRIFTLLPMTIRTTTEDITLPDNKIIPAKCLVGLGIQAVHLNPAFYENPRTWNPENFNPDAVDKRPKYSFMPFGLGPRACIGSKYAMMSLKTQISHILMSYRLTTNMKFADIKPTMDTVVRCKNGYPIKLHHRFMDNI